MHTNILSRCTNYRLSFAFGGSNDQGQGKAKAPSAASSMAQLVAAPPSADCEQKMAVPLCDRISTQQVGL